MNTAILIAATQSTPFMFWFVTGSYWNSAYAGRRLLHDSDGSMRDTLRALATLKRRSLLFTPAGLNIHDALTSRGCVYPTMPMSPLDLYSELQGLPVARLPGCFIEPDTSWMAVISWSPRFPRPEPDCLPNLGPRMLPGWTQSAYFSTSCLSGLISSVVLSSHSSARPRAGSHTWTTATT
jgi:hypothetical protein